jgi:hypothetical protein
LKKTHYKKKKKKRLAEWQRAQVVRVPAIKREALSSNSMLPKTNKQTKTPKNTCLE